MIKMIFLNTGWMKSYRGQRKGDKLTGGGAFVKTHGFGHEILNFDPDRGRLYGYAPVKYRIRLQNLVEKFEGDYLDGVTVVWTAKNPHGGGVYIVGWYKNARLFRNETPYLRRKIRGHAATYFATGLAKQAILLPPDARIFKIPKGGKGEKGTSAAWYADEKFKRKVAEYIRSGRFERSRAVLTGKGRNKQSRQLNLLERLKVEQKAYEVTERYYAGLGYLVKGVQKDNLGWDMEATDTRKSLRLEVKGLSGKDIQVEVTPNEFRQMLGYRNDGYRVCVVTSALTRSPVLTVFSFSPDSGSWTDDGGRQLIIEEVVGARLHLS